MTTFGFIGTGNMGSALTKAAARTLPGEEILLTDRNIDRAAALAEECGCIATDTPTIVQKARYIFLGVKPQGMSELLSELRPLLAVRSTPFVLVTMMAGVPMSRITETLGADYPLIRIMPNTPVSVGEGMILYTRNDLVSEETLAGFLQGLCASGRFAELPEHLIDAGSGVSGCGPAFVDLFVEALADAGVACGLPRAIALESAAQMVLGSAKLILESGKHPGELKDAVCSPGGTTIEGVYALERGNFRGTVMDAVIAAYEKNSKLS